MIFDMQKNKIVFIFKRCEHDDNKILISKNLSFLSIISFIIIMRSFKFIVKNELNENNFDISSLKNISNKKRSTLTLKAFKEMKIKKLNFIDIIEINASTYYYLIRNKEHKLFSLIINKIYDIFIKSFEILL